ncbi:MAG TPA: prenyltransferase/squalene oxidase repeat-containing protein [Oscillospiraceae bacterium]|nr:prenyltransferase/squalene oxidase repeat-containing protein [Oscillospiraceae bacterium]
MNRKFISLVLILLLIISFTTPVIAVSDSSLDSIIKDMTEYIYKTVPNPQVNSIGGEWAVLGLARSDYAIPEEYYENYYKNVQSYVKSCDGNLHDKKYTEYSRVILALTAIGKNPADVEGYNLLTPLGDYDRTIWQGLNGPIWALIALDSGNYPMPENPEAKTQATRNMYIQKILDLRLLDGGWSLSGGIDSGAEESDPDITGMALQALSKYKDRDDVKEAIDGALMTMSDRQNNQGGYSSRNVENIESSVQMIVALGELGIPIENPGFVKDGKNILDNLVNYYLKGKGFSHTKEDSSLNQLSSEQGLYALVAAKRLRDGENSLYLMEDSLNIDDTIDSDSGNVLENKHKENIPEFDIKIGPHINTSREKIARVIFNMLQLTKLL